MKMNFFIIYRDVELDTEMPGLSTLLDDEFDDSEPEEEDILDPESGEELSVDEDEADRTVQILHQAYFS